MTIETRKWSTKYRGYVLLCASKVPKSDLSGKAFAIARIINCQPMLKQDEHDACCEMYPKAHSWFLEMVASLNPFDVKGELGLFEFPKEKQYSAMVSCCGHRKLVLSADQSHGYIEQTFCEHCGCVGRGGLMR